MHQNQNTHHIPVLLEEVLECLAPQRNESYLDLTAGYGGHAAAVLALTQAPEKATLVDRDSFAIEQLRARFENRIETLHNDFLQAAKQLRSESRRYDMILADLGVSSPHLNMASRGFSIQQDGPLDMRMDQTQKLTAEHVVNTYSLEELVRILKDYGEEPKARQIASKIIEARPLTTTHQLASLIARQWSGKSKVHPATRTFQALRIEVNDELGLLRQALPLCMELLAPGGRLAIISFHSLEDRIVKQFFAEKSGNRFDAELKLLSKKPMTGSATEIVSNPRARSAKLRAAVKIKRKG